MKLDKITENKEELKKYILMILDSNGGPNISTHKKYLRQHYPAAILCSLVMSDYKFSLKEINYIIKNNLTEVTTTCLKCGKALDSITKIYCCSKCASTSEVTKNKRVETCLEKYGVDSVFKSKHFKDKTSETVNMKYVVDHINNISEMKEKRKKNLLAKYGVEYIGQIPSVIEKNKTRVIKRKIDRYLPLIKVLKTKNLEMLSAYDEFLELSEPKFKCLVCGNEFRFYNSAKIKDKISCPKCITQLKHEEPNPKNIGKTMVLEKINENKDELKRYIDMLTDAADGPNIAIHNMHLKQNMPDAVVCASVMSEYDFSLKEIKHILNNDMTEISMYCPVCGKKLTSVFQQYCSTKCMSNSDSVKLKKENTSMLKYGAKSHLQTDDIKNKIKQTVLEKYGVDHIFKADVIKNKMENTWLEKYGETNPNKSEKIKNKNKKKNKIKQYDFFTKFLNISFIEMLSSYEQYINNDILKFKCLKCAAEYDGHYTISNQKITRCPECTTKYSSIGEGEVLQFIKDNILNDKSIYLQRDKKEISPFELDIYIPEYKLAIEYNGIYWHSANVRTMDKNYHLNKTNMCIAKGIQLLHIFEHEWLNKRPIVESIVKSKVGIYENLLYARKCEIKTLSNIDYKEFLIANHIQGYAQAAIRLGLFYNNELVSCMGIGKSRFKKDETEVIRFCNKLNTLVVGGLSRLIKHSGEKKLISYVDLRYFDGSGYEKVGFKFVSKSSPDYFYVKGNTILSRWQCQKHKLNALLVNSFDPKLTEVENMTLAGYFQIYGCGMKKYVFEADDKSL